ncbi:YozQ family protein [Aquibacillus albus]|uniref:DUF4025 domain-containing protein n=1 Tax=Aquibacillus albus TaxID=1168171 RepID=A0ABS2MWZ1_9BACI|nr:YozQ family protein [Aquibacillus albus]MBM7570418.1 hypothetical protein [Aquibacillus albus]
MAKHNKKLPQEEASKVAGKMYDPSDYQADSDLSKGTAITHEQSSDAYTEGTVDGHIDDVNKNGELKSGKGEDIPRKGY